MVNGNIAEDIEQGVNLIREIGEERGGSVIFTYAENLLTKLGAESKCRRVAFEALLIIIRSDPKKCAHLFDPMLDALGEGIELLVGTFIFIRKFLQRVFVVNRQGPDKNSPDIGRFYCGFAFPDPFWGYIFFSILIQESAINPRDFRDLGFIF